MTHWPVAHWDVGKYAAFVQAAYGLSTATLVLLVGQTWFAARRWRRAAERRNPPP